MQELSFFELEGIAKLRFGAKFALALPIRILRKMPIPHSDMSFCEEPNRLCDHRILLAKRVLQLPQTGFCALWARKSIQTPGFCGYLMRIWCVRRRDLTSFCLSRPSSSKVRLHSSNCPSSAFSVTSRSIVSAKVSRRRFPGPGCGFDAVADHDDRGFFGLRLRPGIAELLIHRPLPYGRPSIRAACGRNNRSSVVP